MKKIILLLIIAIAIPSFIYSQTSYTTRAKSTLMTIFQDNNTGDITPQNLRDGVGSAFDAAGDSARKAASDSIVLSVPRVSLKDSLKNNHSRINTDSLQATGTSLVVNDSLRALGFNAGSATSYLNIDNYGRITAIGDSAYWWKEIIVRVTATARNAASVKPDFVQWGTLGQGYSFDAATAESLYFSFEIPHDALVGAGQVLDTHVHWGASTTDTGNCAWKVAWTIANVNGTFTNAAGDTISARQAGTGTARQNQYLDLGNISLAAVTGVSSIVTACILRDAAKSSDTFTGEAYLLDIGFHYKANVLGSRWETIK